MDLCLQPPGVQHEPIAKDMIDMPVGIEKPDGLELMQVDRVRQVLFLLAGIASRIDDQTFPCVVKYQIGIFGKGAIGQ